jgi:hypothetical protein
LKACQVVGVQVFGVQGFGVPGGMQGLHGTRMAPAPLVERAGGEVLPLLAREAGDQERAGVRCSLSTCGERVPACGWWDEVERGRVCIGY